MTGSKTLGVIKGPIRGVRFGVPGDTRFEGPRPQAASVNTNPSTTPVQPSPAPVQPQAPISEPDAGYGSSGSNFNPITLLQQMNAGTPPPTPVAGSNSQAPAEAAMVPPPTIFDIGNPVAANPNLGRRNPAMEGLIESFRRRNIY